MKVQKSFQPEQDAQGELYIVPTPIGNLEDITYRALRILTEVDQIAAEDTRQTKKLLNHFDVHTPLLSYHEHNKFSREDALIDDLKEGKKLAIVSDAGMPGVSDPGFEIVKRAIAEDISVVVLPGANAALCALVGSGLDTSQFTFYGFLPRKKKERKEELERLSKKQETLVFYESPHRLKEMMKALQEALGDRNVVLARELTKKYEEYIRGTATEVLDWINKEQVRGEFCIIVEGSMEEEVELEEEWWSALSLEEHVEKYIHDGYTSKDAIKQASVDRKIPKREVYQAYHT